MGVINNYVEIQKLKKGGGGSSGGEFQTVSNPFVSLQFFHLDVAGLETCSVSTNGVMAQFAEWLYPSGLTFTVPANVKRDFYLYGTLKTELAAKGKIFHKAVLRCSDQSNVIYEFELNIVQIGDVIESIGGSHTFDEAKTFTVSEIIFDGTPWFI